MAVCAIFARIRSVSAFQVAVAFRAVAGHLLSVLRCVLVETVEFLARRHGESLERRRGKSPTPVVGAALVSQVGELLRRPPPVGRRPTGGQVSALWPLGSPLPPWRQDFPFGAVGAVSGLLCAIFAGSRLAAACCGDTAPLSAWAARGLPRPVGRCPNSCAGAALRPSGNFGAGFPFRTPETLSGALWAISRRVRPLVAASDDLSVFSGFRRRPTPAPAAGPISGFSASNLRRSAENSFWPAAGYFRPRRAGLTLLWLCHPSLPCGGCGRGYLPSRWAFRSFARSSWMVRSDMPR